MSDKPRIAPGSLYAGISFGQASTSASLSSTASLAPEEDPVNAPKKNWSTALAFAPSRRAPPQKPKPPRPSAALYFTSTSEGASGPKPTDIVREAAPVLREIKPNPTPAPAKGGFNRALPLLTLEEDINGFNKRPQSLNHDSSNPKKKKKKRQGNKQEPARPSFDPFELYDPAKPNDIEEYTRWREEERKRKERLRREKRENAMKVDSESESSYYTEDEDEEQERGKEGYIGQPPPSSYDPPTLSNPYPVFQPSSQPPPRTETGDEAYQRRLALSSQPPSSSIGLNPIAPSFVPSVPSVVASRPDESGEEAYLRRVALSSMQRPPISISGGGLPPPSSLPLAQESPNVGGTESEEFQKKVEERKRAAAAIAARFAKPNVGAVGTSLGGGTPAAIVPEKTERDPNDTRDFATRMMDKWGHKAGEGLGVDASGIASPLLVSQSTKPKQHSSSASQPRATAKIISETTARKQAEDLAKYGASSRIVLLEHMVGGVEEVDNELSEDIAEECGKFGVVERVVIHQIHPAPPRAEDSIRVFVVFSGPAGAWQAIRSLDDRFFGGRTVKASYFNEAKFERGDRDS